jgi:hypothetical protein
MLILSHLVHFHVLYEWTEAESSMSTYWAERLQQRAEDVTRELHSRANRLESMTELYTRDIKGKTRRRMMHHNVEDRKGFQPDTIIRSRSPHQGNDAGSTRARSPSRGSNKNSNNEPMSLLQAWRRSIPGQGHVASLMDKPNRYQSSSIPHSHPSWIPPPLPPPSSHPQQQQQHYNDEFAGTQEHQQARQVPRPSSTLGSSGGGNRRPIWRPSSARPPQRPSTAHPRSRSPAAPIVPQTRNDAQSDGSESQQRQQDGEEAPTTTTTTSARPQTARARPRTAQYTPMQVSRIYAPITPILASSVAAQVVQRWLAAAPLAQPVRPQTARRRPVASAKRNAVNKDHVMNPFNELVDGGSGASTAKKHTLHRSPKRTNNESPTAAAALSGSFDAQLDLAEALGLNDEQRRKLAELTAHTSVGGPVARSPSRSPKAPNTKSRLRSPQNNRSNASPNNRVTPLPKRPSSTTSSLASASPATPLTSTPLVTGSGAGARSVSLTPITPSTPLVTSTSIVPPPTAPIVPPHKPDFSRAATPPPTSTVLPPPTLTTPSTAPLPPPTTTVVSPSSTTPSIASPAAGTETEAIATSNGSSTTKKSGARWSAPASELLKLGLPLQPPALPRTTTPTPVSASSTSPSPTPSLDRAPSQKLAPLPSPPPTTTITTPPIVTATKEPISASLGPVQVSTTAAGSSNEYGDEFDEDAMAGLSDEQRAYLRRTLSAATNTSTLHASSSKSLRTGYDDESFEVEYQPASPTSVPRPGGAGDGGSGNNMTTVARPPPIQTSASSSSTPAVAIQSSVPTLSQSIAPSSSVGTPSVPSATTISATPPSNTAPVTAASSVGGAEDLASMKARWAAKMAEEPVIAVYDDDEFEVEVEGDSPLPLVNAPSPLPPSSTSSSGTTGAATRPLRPQSASRSSTRPLSAGQQRSPHSRPVSGSSSRANPNNNVISSVALPIAPSPAQLSQTLPPPHAPPSQAAPSDDGYGNDFEVEYAGDGFDNDDVAVPVKKAVSRSSSKQKVSIVDDRPTSSSVPAPSPPSNEYHDEFDADNDTDGGDMKENKSIKELPSTAATLPIATTTTTGKDSALPKEGVMTLVLKCRHLPEVFQQSNPIVVVERKDVCITHNISFVCPLFVFSSCVLYVCLTSRDEMHGHQWVQQKLLNQVMIHHLQWKCSCPIHYHNHILLSSGTFFILVLQYTCFMFFLSCMDMVSYGMIVIVFIMWMMIQVWRLIMVIY